MLLLMLSNPLSAFTMDDDQRMLLDKGLATVFTIGILNASFVASNVLGREIEIQDRPNSSFENLFRNQHS